MADDDLRALARALEARPGDAAARWAYARALARAGDAEGERAQLRALAWAGDDVARLLLQGPWPIAAGPGRTRRTAASPVRAIGRVRRRGFDDSSGHAGPELMAASDELVFVRTGPSLVALEALDQRPRWTRPFAPVALLRRDRLVGARGDRLEALDARTGEPVASAPAPAVQRLHVDLERVVAREGSYLVGVDGADERLGELLWTRQLDALIDLVLAGPWLVAVCGRNPASHRVEVLRLDTGVTVGVRPAADLDRHGLPRLSAADARGVVVGIDDGAGEGGPAPRSTLVAELSLPDLAVRWSIAAAARGEGVAALGHDLALLPRGATALDAIDRDSGATRWSVALPPGPAATAIAGDVCYVAALDGTELRLRAHDLTTGAARFEVGLERDVRGVTAVDVLAMERAAAVTAGRSLHVVREA